MHHRIAAVLCLVALSFSVSALRAEEGPSITIEGPSEVAVGETITLTASTSSDMEETYYWFVSYQSGSSVLSVTDGEVKGLSIGTGIVSVFGSKSAASTTKEITVTSKEGTTLSLGVGMVYDNDDIQLEVNCILWDDAPAGGDLYAAVMIKGAVYFLPHMTPEMKPFRTAPTTGTVELLQIPMVQVPVDTYTFYAAVMDKDGNLMSNLAEKSFTGGGSQTSQ